MRRGILSAMAIVVLFAASGHYSARAGLLYIDVGPSGSPVQEGWQAFTGGHTNSGTTTHTFDNDFGRDGTIDVSIWVTSEAEGTPTHGMRSRTPIVDGSPFVGLRDLLSNKAKADSLVTGGGHETLHLELGNLSAGSYDLVTYHHRSHTNDPGSINVLLDDFYGTDQLVTTDFVQTWGPDPDSIASHRLRFHADGESPVVVHFQEIFGTGTGDNEALLNGFILIPEPSSVLLLGLAVACLLVAPRRKRKD